jgi:hypothetical protein
MRELQSLGLDIAAHKVELFENGQSHGVEVDLMSNDKYDFSLPNQDLNLPASDANEDFFYEEQEILNDFDLTSEI